jgi:glutaminase
VTVLFSEIDNASLLRRFMKVKLGARFDELVRIFENIDAALEWCEDRLLARLIPAAPDTSMAVQYFDILAGLSTEEILIFNKLCVRRTYEPGETIINAGDPARELFLLSRGTVSVFLPIEGGVRKRLATFTPGSAFGEMAIIDHAPRSATILADVSVTCELLSVARLTALGHTHPRIKIQILENISLALCRKLRKANREISLLV